MPKGDDPLANVEIALALIRGTKEAAYKLGFAEGRFRKHLEALTSEEEEMLAGALRGLKALQKPKTDEILGPTD